MVASAKQNASLGSLPKFASHAKKRDETKIARQWRLKKLVGKLVPSSKTATCLERPTFGNHYIQVIHHPQTNTATYSGLKPCDRVWTCPVCAEKITARRREEMTLALAAAKQQGLTPVLLTFTARHHLSDALAGLLDGLIEAHRAFKSGREFQDIREEYSWIGSIRDLESTWGEINGWHPHIHELVFLDIPKAHFNPGGLKKWASDRWRHVLQKRGYDASYEHGLDVRTADSDIAEYVAKWGHEPLAQAWGIEHEVARSPVKKADHGGFTPFQLLELYGDGNKQAGALFAEYAKVFEGRKQLFWSKGLKDLLQIEELPTADDGMMPAGARLLALIAKEQWRKVVYAGLEAFILELARLGDFKLLAAALADRQIYIIDPPYHEIDLPPPKERKRKG